MGGSALWNKVINYQKEKFKFYKLLINRVITNYDRLHYLYQDENSNIILNKRMKSISYYYDFARPIMQELFPETSYNYIKSQLGYFSLRATKFTRPSGYKIETTENNITAEIPGGKISISFHSYFSLFNFTQNIFSDPYIICEVITNPCKNSFYEIPKKLNIPEDFCKLLFIFRHDKSQDISACLAALANLEYLYKQPKLIDFIAAFNESLIQVKELDPIHIFFNWKVFFQSIYISWVLLSFDQAIVNVDKQKSYQKIIIPTCSVDISITDE